MRKVIGVVAMAALAIASTAWAADIAGKIKSVDRAYGDARGWDPAHDPGHGEIDSRALKPGADVKASYEAKGSEKVVTSIEALPAATK